LAQLIVDFEDVPPRVKQGSSQEKSTTSIQHKFDRVISCAADPTYVKEPWALITGDRRLVIFDPLSMPKDR